jgi:hypothetical protein
MAIRIVFVDAFLLSFVFWELLPHYWTFITKKTYYLHYGCFSSSDYHSIFP